MIKKNCLLLVAFFCSFLFFISTISSEEIPAHNVPIQLNFHHYPSLEAFQEAIEGEVSLHMTLLFTQIADNMIDQKMHKIFVQRIQEDFQVKKMLENICLKFKKFGFLGSYLVAFYEPVKRIDRKTEEAWPEYINLIKRCRMIINRAAAEFGHIEYITTRDVIGNGFSEQWSWINGKEAYSLDIRSPIPHISLKRGGTSDDLITLNLLMKDTLNAPSFFFIKLTHLSAIPTKSARLDFYKNR